MATDPLHAGDASTPASIGDLDVRFDFAGAEERLRELDAAVTPGRASLARSLMGAEALPTPAIRALAQGRVITSETAAERAVRRFERACAAGVARPSMDRAALLGAHRRIVPGGGTIRKHVISVGRSRTTGEAIFLPPPPGLLSDLVRDLVAFLAREDLSPLAQACVGFAQLELIHPFADGNGRLGRWLLQVVPRRRGLVRRLVAPLGVVFAANPSVFLAAHAAYRRGDVAAWCGYITDCVDQAAAAARPFIERSSLAPSRRTPKAPAPSR